MNNVLSHKTKKVPTEEPKERDIVILKLGKKYRPALCLRRLPKKSNYRFLVCGISSQTGRLRYFEERLDECIDRTDSADEKLSKLRGPSIIQLGFLFWIDKDDIPGRIGYISEKRHERLLEKLSKYLLGSYLPKTLR